MRKSLSLLIMTLLIATLSNGQEANPFFSSWNTPFGVPPFEQIQNGHYEPAFMEAMASQQKEINAIVNNPEGPTFENTIVALDQSGEMLSRVSAVFYGLNSANTNPEMQKIAKSISPLLTRHGDDINMNMGLFKRIKDVYLRRGEMKLSADQDKLLTETYKGFIRGGAGLADEQKDQLRKLNEEINLLQLTFGQNLLAATNGYKLIIENKDQLSGLPAALVNSSKQISTGQVKKEQYVFTLQNPSVIPFLQYADDRGLRKEIMGAYLNRCNGGDSLDNKEIISRLVFLRLEKAKLMGYPDWSSFALEDRMAKNPASVYRMLDQIWTPALNKAKGESESLQQSLEALEKGGQLQSWDWRYFSEKVKKSQFDIDEEMLKPYFKIENVQEGIFQVVQKLYGIRFNEIRSAPVYAKGVKLYECVDEDNTHLGVLYLDFFPRPGKRGGAWCGTYRSQSYRDGKRVAPVVTIVTNFTPPSGELPSLLTSDEVETFFHEFGHALHNLFRNVQYKGIASVPRDFVELPSQIMEHWAFHPRVLPMYARHYLTGEVIPDELIRKIELSDKYGQGFKTTEYLAACYLDMDYHTDRSRFDKVDPSKPPVSDVTAEAGMNEGAPLDVIGFEKESMNRIGLIPQIPPRYRSTYFQHTMTGGYTAGYYSYIWAEVLDADAFSAFEESGDIFNTELSNKFRKFILEPGGSKDAMQMYMDFRGREPDINALLKYRGLN